MSTERPRPSTPHEALERLLEGNRHFLTDEHPSADISALRRLEVAREQHPFATLVGCSDSRVGPEFLFGTGLGELFIVRAAGSILDQYGFGSVIFSVELLQVPLIMVLGHQNCGAVAAAVNAVATNEPIEGAMGPLVQAIVPAVVEASGQPDDGDLARRAGYASIRRTVGALRRSTEPSLRNALDAGAIGVVGAYYSLASGAVEIVDPLDGP